MKTLLFRFIFVLTLFISLSIEADSYAQTLVSTVEAETGVLSGVTIANQTSNSSGNYVTGFDADGDKLTITVNVSTSAYYRLEITYRGNQGTKTQDVYVNNVFHGNVTFPFSNNFLALDLGNIYLNAGNNTIAVVKNWGYMDIDKFSFYTSQPNVFNIAADLVDPLASPATKNLYNFLRCQFGNTIISGQTESEFDKIKSATGKTPMLKAYDFQPYTQGYPYKWNGSGHSFGAVDNQITEAAIAWYESTGKKGIISFQWHWHSPTGGAVSRNTFWTSETTFDIRQAIIPGTSQYIDILENIDAIAVQLKKLQTANVPVIWRPLHEAGGTWFWWGAHGSQPSKVLYDILYDRIVNHHGIHNLIWAWSSPEADWYPGNDKVDLIGYDSYPGAYNYTIQKTIFDQLYKIVNGEKLIAMTENGPIPDIEKSLTMDAPWSYFMTWAASNISENSTTHLNEVYNNPKVLTIENHGSCVEAPTVTSPVFYCQGTNAIVLSATGTNLKWYSNATDGTGSTTAPTPSTTTVGSSDYYVSQTINGIESSRAMITVTVNASPSAPTVQSTVTYCQNANVSPLTATGSNLNWYTIASGGTASANAPKPSTSSVGSTDYFVSETTNGCESQRSKITVTINSLPTASISSSGTTSFCQGGSVTLTSSPGNSYVWKKDGMQVGTAQAYTATSSGSYTVEVSNANSCKATSAATTVTVNSSPSAIITTSGATTFCEGGSVTLTSSSGSSYVWKKDGIQVGNSQEYTATSSGSYTVEVSNAIPCSATSSEITILVSDSQIWYADNDNDGVGDANISLHSCETPNGYVSTIGDNCPTDGNKTEPGDCGCNNTETSCLDCFGDPNGTAFLDACTICAGGNTGIIPKMTEEECVTGVVGYGSIEVSVFPNPFKSQIQIIGLVEPTNYKIMDLRGVVIQDGMTDGEINLENLASGVYQLVIITEKVSVTKLSKENE